MTNAHNQRRVHANAKKQHHKKERHRSSAPPSTMNMALVCRDGQLPCHPKTTNGQPKTSAVHRLTYGGNRWAGLLAARPFTAGIESEVAASSIL